MPFSLGKSFQHGFHLAGQRRRGNVTGQEAQARALTCLLGIQRHLQGGEEASPGAHLAQFDDSLRTVRIIEIKNGTLGKNIAAHAAGRVIRIAIDLDGTAHVAFDQDGPGNAAQRHGGGKVKRLAGDNLFRLPDVRNNVLDRLLGAGT